MFFVPFVISNAVVLKRNTATVLRFALSFHIPWNGNSQWTFVMYVMEFRGFCKIRCLNVKVLRNIFRSSPCRSPLLSPEAITIHIAEKGVYNQTCFSSDESWSYIHGWWLESIYINPDPIRPRCSQKFYFTENVWNLFEFSTKMMFEIQTQSRVSSHQWQQKRFDICTGEIFCSCPPALISYPIFIIMFPWTCLMRLLHFIFIYVCCLSYTQQRYKGFCLCGLNQKLRVHKWCHFIRVFLRFSDGDFKT